MNLKPYPKYKDSGIEWLGKIPEGWGVIPIRRIGKVINGSTPESSNEEFWEGHITWITPEDLGNNQAKYITDSKRKITNKGYKYCGTTLVPKNSLIISTRAPIGHLALSSTESCFNQGCRGIVFQKKYAPSFYYYFLWATKDVLNAYGQGTTFFELGANKLASLPIAVPPHGEQTTIASFLDHKTSRIDELIKKNENLVELLREKRQAIISHAVTKGLDPNAKMKDSGIGWIGEIPEGWEVKRLKYVASINPEALTENTASDYEMKYVDISNVNEEGLINEPELIVFSDAPSRARRRIRKDDVIVSTVRTYLKAIAYFPNPDSNLIVSTGFAVLRASNKIISKFLHYFVRSDFFVESIMANSVGVSYPAINSSVLASLAVLLPTINEQALVTDFLDKETKNIDDLIKKILSQIEKLKEYRQVLISNVVTGKVRIAD